MKKIVIWVIVLLAIMFIWRLTVKPLHSSFRDPYLENNGESK